MPNLTFYISAPMPSEADLAHLSDDCMQLCTGVLAAQQQNVHVIFVAARPGHGLPIHVQVQYRLEPFRTPEVLQRFMHKLQASIVRHTTSEARIRCFGYGAGQIHAFH